MYADKAPKAGIKWGDGAVEIERTKAKENCPPQVKVMVDGVNVITFLKDTSGKVYGYRPECIDLRETKFQIEKNNAGKLFVD